MLNISSLTFVSFSNRLIKTPFRPWGMHQIEGDVNLIFGM